MFSLDNKFYRICTVIYTYLVLNLLFLAACVLVVTIPAAVAALFAVARKIVYKEEPAIWKTFWVSFRENFIQATFVGIFFFVLAWVLSEDLRVLHGHTLFSSITAIILFFAGYCAVTTLLHAYAIMVHIRSKTWQILKDAFRLSLIQPHLTLFIVMLISIFLTISVKFPFLLIVCFFSFSAVVTYWFIDRKFIRLGMSVTRKDEEKEEEQRD